ncbi:hypothetical protein [Pantoea sp. C2G6]|uniref:hypothetical protein n=1 Tax=Pantoea sp. C2G6 TaxID=3243084 RepID=UPI003ED93EAE
MAAEREVDMDDESVSDAMAACRLLLGEAVMVLIAEDKPVTAEAIAAKIAQICNGFDAAPVRDLAIALLKNNN